MIGVVKTYGGTSSHQLQIMNESLTIVSFPDMQGFQDCGVMGLRA